MGTPNIKIRGQIHDGLLKLRQFSYGDRKLRTGEEMTTAVFANALLSEEKKSVFFQTPVSRESTNIATVVLRHVREIYHATNIIAANRAFICYESVIEGVVLSRYKCSINERHHCNDGPLHKFERRDRRGTPPCVRE